MYIVSTNIARGATVTERAPAMRFCCKGFYKCDYKVKMQEKIQKD